MISKFSAVIAVVIAEAADLGQPDAVLVEPDDLVQARCVPGLQERVRRVWRRFG